MKKRLKRITSLLLAAMIAATSAAYAPPASGSQGVMPYVALEAPEDMATPSEAVKATPSDAVPDEEISTPSQAEKSFVRVEPEEEDIPKYYSQVSMAGKRFWKFEDRNGSVQYRDYGYIQGEAEFPLWYCFTDEGDFDIGESSLYSSGVDLNDEYRILAPYLYVSAEPTAESWKELECLITRYGGLDNQNKKEINGYRNWDQTEYSIFHLTAKEPGEELEEPEKEMPGDAGQPPEDLGYFFYGRVPNNEDSETCWWYADEDGKVTSVVTAKRFMALAAGVTKYVRLWHDIPGCSKTTTQSYEYQITASSYHLPSLFDYVFTHAGTPDNTAKIIDFRSNHVGWSTSRTRTTDLVSQDGADNWVSLQDDPAKTETYLSGGTLYPSSYDYGLSDATLFYSFYGVWCPENADMYIFFAEPYHGEASYTPYKTSTIIVRRDTTFPLSKASIPAKAGFTFTGWSFPEGIVDAQSSDPISCGHTGKVTYVYPAFLANENTVRFFDADGNLLSEQTVISGNAATPPEAPNRTGYVFTGWDKSYTNVLNALDITAQYKSTATLNIVGSGGTVYGEEQYSTELALNTSLSTTLSTIQSNLARDGYRFTSWYYFDENGVQKSGYPSKITGDLTLYVSWTIMSYGNKFYYRLDYSIYYTAPTAYMDYVKLPETDPPKIDGYIFDGWYTAQSGGEKLEENAVVQGSAAKVYYAHYKEDNVNITFDFNISGETNIKTMSVLRKKVYLTSLDIGTVTRPFYFNGNWVDSTGKVYLYVSDITGDFITLYRAWLGWDTYVRFYNNTGSPFENQAYVYTVRYGQPIKSYNPELPVGVNGSKVFIGWYTEKTGGNKVTPDTIVENGDTITTITKISSGSSGEVPVYAHYADASNTVTFKGWDGTVLETQEVAYGEASIPPEAPVRPGYIFIGWDTDTTNIQAPVTITAQYIRNTYTLTFDGNGGELDGAATRTQEFSYGESIDQALADGSTGASRKYFTFDGWYTEADGGSKYTGTGMTMPETDIAVYAHWVRSASEAVYKDFDGTVLKRQEVSIGADATPPQVPERSGYTFTGWDQASTNIRDHVTITAQYTINGYLLTLDGNGGSMNGSATKEQVLSFAESFDQVLINGRDLVIRPGYHFDGWYTGLTGGSSYSYSGNQMPAADVTVYAHWTPITYKVTFDPDHERWSGGTVEENHTFDTELGTLPAPEIYGWKFTGWRTRKNGAGTRITDHSMVEPNDVTYYGSWEPNAYQIHFISKVDQPGGEAVQTFTVSQDYDSPLGTLPVPEESGYTFTGWYDGNNEKVGSQTIFCPDSGAEGYTYHAGWAANTYKIHFTYEDLDGKPVTIEMNGTYFTQIGTLPAPEKPGYTFIGWFKDSGEEVTSGSWVEAGDTVYKARWKANRYTIYFERNLPDSVITENPEDQTVTYGSSIGELPVLHETGYLFLGWYTEPTGGIRIQETTPAALGDQTYYVHWIKGWIAHGNGTHSRPGTDGKWNTEDDEHWWNGPDGIPGTEDDQIIYIGGSGGTTIHYIDNGDGTHTRPGAGGWSESHTEHWWNGPDGIPGTDDDRIIIIGGTGSDGNPISYIDHGDGTHTRPGDGGNWNNGDTEHWWNGPDGVPGTGDDREIHTGGSGGTVQYIDNGDGTHTRPGADGTWGTEEDEIWLNGPDGAPGTPDDSKKNNGGNSGEPTEPTEPNKPDPTEPNKPDPTEPTQTEPGNTVPTKEVGKDQEEETVIIPPVSAIDTTIKPAVPDTGGTFTVNPENLYDVTYTKPDGTPAKDEWVGDGKDWYHVDEDGKLNYDWYLEGEKTWYKLNKETGDRFGAALISWNNEPMDDKRYFFNPTTTKMLTGWQNIDGKWYYFTRQNESQTYFGNNRAGWKYDPTKPGKPYGSMYQGEDTPDGYKVDENGVWIN